MKLVRITEAQASFLEVEIVGRYIDDEEEHFAAVADIVREHLVRSNGTAMAVPHDTLVEMLLDVANAIDDEIEQLRKGKTHWSRLEIIGELPSLADARRLHRTAEALLAKARRARSAR